VQSIFARYIAYNFDVYFARCITSFNIMYANANNLTNTNSLCLVQFGSGCSK